MKKILVTLIVSVLSIGSAFAYTQVELDSKIATYKTVLSAKIWPKLENISEEKLDKILILVDTLILKYESDTSLSDSRKIIKVGMLMAFKEIVSEKLEDDFSDINAIFNAVNEKVEIIIITDERCWETCATDELISQLKNIPSLGDANFVEMDYSEDVAKSTLASTWIDFLPAAIFKNNDISELSNFLKPTNDFKYSLELGSIYDPTISRSAKGFRYVDLSVISTIVWDSHIKWDKNANILWLEYSDMECPFCAKLHSNWTHEELEEKYWNQLTYSLQHFPLDFHKNALTAAEYLECVWKIKWTEAFYQLEDKIFASTDSSKDFIIETAVWEMWINKETLASCFDNNEFTSKITSQQERGTTLFWITGTPGNVLINTETGEYEVISWAYPTSSFIDVIDKLLK